MNDKQFRCVGSHGKENRCEKKNTCARHLNWENNSPIEWIACGKQFEHYVKVDRKLLGDN